MNKKEKPVKTLSDMFFVYGETCDKIVNETSKAMDDFCEDSIDYLKDNFKSYKLSKEKNLFSNSQS